MDSLQSILAGRQREEPPEIAAIKQYVHEHCGATVSVALKQNAIIITAKSAALAGTLRMQTTQIARAAGTNKKLFFRIG